MSAAEPTVNKHLVTGACPRCLGKLHPLLADSEYVADKCAKCGGSWWHQTPLPLHAAEVMALGHAKRIEESLARERAALAGLDLSDCAPQGWTFHRIQRGYADGIPRAVFILPDGEPFGLPLIRGVAAIMALAVRMASKAAR